VRRDEAVRRFDIAIVVSRGEEVLLGALKSSEMRASCGAARPPQA